MFKKFLRKRESRRAEKRYMYIINVSNNVFHSVVEKENRKISDGEQRSNLKIDSNKIHGKRTRWFLVDFSISHGLVIVRVNCVENCILLSIGWISRSRNSHCPILFSARNFRQLPRTFPPSFTFGFRWWSFCRGIFKWVQRKGKLILLDIHRTSRRPISTRTVARRKGRTRRRCRSCCEISHGSTTPLPPCDSLSRSCLWPPSCTVDRRYEQNRSWKKRASAGNRYQNFYLDDTRPRKHIELPFFPFIIFVRRVGFRRPLQFLFFIDRIIAYLL